MSRQLDASIWKFRATCCSDSRSGRAYRWYAHAIPGLTERFNPTVVVDGQALQLHPLGIAVFFVSELRHCAGSANPNALQIETALGMLLRGYRTVPSTTQQP